MDQRFENMYHNLQRTKTIFLFFANLSIFVSCLGLFALSIYIAEQGEKEFMAHDILEAADGKHGYMSTVIVYINRQEWKK